jgi:hypothetical protein
MGDAGYVAKPTCNFQAARDGGCRACRLCATRAGEAAASALTAEAPHSHDDAEITGM